MKNKFIISCLLLAFVFSSFAQSSDNQMVLVNYVKVKPSNVNEYYAAMTNFNKMVKKFNVPDVQWFSHLTDNFTFVNAVPIDNMAQLDKPFWATTIKSIGEDKFETLIDALEANSVDSHNEVYYMRGQLGYAHKDLADQQTTHRRWTFFRCKPGERNDVLAIAGEFKALMIKKNIPLNYQVYLGIIGPSNEMVVRLDYGKNAADMAQRDMKAQELMGDEGQALWDKMLKHCNEIEVMEGTYMPAISYSPPPVKKPVEAAKSTIKQD